MVRFLILISLFFQSTTSDKMELFKLYNNTFPAETYFNFITQSNGKKVFALNEDYSNKATLLGKSGGIYSLYVDLENKVTGISASFEEDASEYFVEKLIILYGEPKKKIKKDILRSEIEKSHNYSGLSTHSDINYKNFDQVIIFYEWISIDTKAILILDRSITKTSLFINKI